MKWEDFPGPDGGNDSGAISVPNFADHVMKMHADSDAGFAKEYSEIQKLSYNKYSSDQSSHPDNKCKNRYLNIVACKLYTFDLTKFLTFFLKCEEKKRSVNGHRLEITSKGFLFFCNPLKIIAPHCPTCTLQVFRSVCALMH